jgi:3'(2'), 5'-bisphosphate nucleotidase
MSGWRSETKRIEGFIARQYGKEAFEIDSSSGIFRTCRLAEGLADMTAVYTDRPQGRIAFWDVAAGHAIVEAAGGRVETWEGKPLMYNDADFYAQPYIALSPSLAKSFKIKL